MKTFDVVALGELLVDFTENGISAQGNPMLEANPGGAPAMYCRCYKTKETTQDLLEKSENAFLTPPFFCDYNSDDSKMSEVLAAIQKYKAE